MHFFIERALEDEFDAIDFDVWRLDDDQLVRIVHAMLADPRSLVTSPATQQPILCDTYGTAGPDDSCTKVILQAMVDAMTYLESPQGYATADPAAWRWGKLHQLVIPPLLPDPGLTLPAESSGFPRAGDNFAISRSDRGWQSVGVSRSAGGSVERILAEATLDVVTGKPTIAMKWAFPGGVIFDSRSPHDRDLLDTYLTNHYASAPYSIDQIVLAGEARWVFH
jgi:acyl-homoserine lactone acylase PvdQ